MALFGATLLASLALGAGQQSEPPPAADSRFTMGNAKVVAESQPRAFEVRGGSLQRERKNAEQYSIVVRHSMSKAGGNTCDPAGDLIFRDGFEG